MMKIEPGKSRPESKVIDVSASSLGSEVRAVVERGGGIGRVHSCFSKAINILFDRDELVSVVDQSVGSGPFNVVVGLPYSLSLDALCLNSGQIVHATRDLLLIGNCLRITIRDSPLYISKHDFETRMLDTSRIRDNIDRMKRTVEMFGRFEGLRPLLQIFPEETTNNLFATSCIESMNSLLSSIQSDDFGEVKRSSQALVGLGLGLTPAADDVLSGFMLSYYLVTHNLGGNLERVSGINKIISESFNQTTIISRSYLKLAATGDGTQLAVSVIESLLTSSSESSGVERATLGLLGVGATSGTDFAIGVALGSTLALTEYSGKRQGVVDDS